MQDDEKVVPFEALADTDLIVDQLYDGGQTGTMADDPLARLLPVGNQGGFRYSGSPRKGTVRLAVLYTTGAEPDWPDVLDPQTGVFTYYGDNRSPGHELHDTRRWGNLLLRDAFDWSHESADARQRIPPFLLFEKAAPGRRIMFRGLLAPGGAGLSSDDELQAIWRSTGGRRFQNYRARFTVLDVARIERAWIADILDGQAAESPLCPPEWSAWVEGRKYTPMLAPSTTVVRSRTEQLPSDAAGRAILTEIREAFRGREHDFEPCAVELWRLIAPATGRCDVTQASRDGGRDAVGEYVVGPASDPITIDFALEAKCYSETNSIGVREVARLISRLRHRHFGVFVTTSHFNQQVYSEVRADGHPIALICGRDIVEALRAAGHSDVLAVKAWLRQFESTAAERLMDRPE
ncbi:restriction endonuclease [Pseudonocardia kujensis]|uniref:restriction endonuclease n=1 Tax=Pseudonocardia kujensis TaxID=1128675 RepID=UPI001E5E5C96|nr:restriction endonuclease [Pseudonocardia kujensis]MCE0764768.1 restriction endonuclease [Pseudonocardia kujensis]